MPVDDGDDHAVAGRGSAKRFRHGFWPSGCHAPASLRRRPSSVEAVGRGYGSDADVAPCLADDAGRGNRLVGDRTLIGNDERTIGAGFAQPVGAVDGALPEVVVDAFQRLFQGLVVSRR